MKTRFCFYYFIFFLSLEFQLFQFVVSTFLLIFFIEIPFLLPPTPQVRDTLHYLSLANFNLEMAAPECSFASGLDFFVMFKVGFLALIKIKGIILK